MVHDIVSSIFYEYDQENIHPSKRNLLPSIGKVIGYSKKGHTTKIAEYLVSKFSNH